MSCTANCCWNCYWEWFVLLTSNFGFDKQGKRPVKYQHLAYTHLKTIWWTHRFKFTNERQYDGHTGSSLLRKNMLFITMLKLKWFHVLKNWWSRISKKLFITLCCTVIEIVSKGFFVNLFMKVETNSS